jgi:hypothetical protein
MATNEPLNTGLDTRTHSNLTGVRAASTICLLAGIWFFVSPWVYGAYTSGNAWNSWIVGAIMFLIGCTRVARPASLIGLSWLNMVLGIWAFFSPWIYGYTANTGRFINSLCVGVIVFVFSIASQRLASRTSPMPASRP